MNVKAKISLIIIALVAIGAITTVKMLDDPLTTFTYKVNPTFATVGEDGGKDPYANPDYKGPIRQPVQKYLEDVGIHFSNGAEASFDESDCTLTVTNTQEQIELVDALLMSFYPSDYQKQRVN